LSTEPQESEDAAKGWARLPRWQHLILIVLCLAGLVAAVANAWVATTSGNRAMHAGFGLVVAVVLVTLVTSYRRRSRA
jgi:membrane protein YdbS with pleckstrin-like domain